VTCDDDDDNDDDDGDYPMVCTNVLDSAWVMDSIAVEVHGSDAEELKRKERWVRS
jgi:hypothetical protein